MQISVSDREADGALVLLAQGGDADAFVAIMRRHNRRLFRAARAILRDEAEAEDAVQDSYIRAFNGLGKLAEPQHLATWLVRIVVNESLRRRARQRPEEASDDDGAAAERVATPDWAGPEATTARAEIRRLIEAAIDRLPDKLRAVFVLRAIEEISVEETAALLNVPAETVKTRFFRGKQALKQSLSRELGAVLNDAFPFDGARCDRLVARVLARLDLKPRAGSPPG